jgi:hypothetical protein
MIKVAKQKKTKTIMEVLIIMAKNKDIDHVESQIMNAGY